MSMRQHKGTFFFVNKSTTGCQLHAAVFFTCVQFKMKIVSKLNKVSFCFYFLLLYSIWCVASTVRLFLLLLNFGRLEPYFFYEVCEL